MIWTDEADKLLIARWYAGASMTQVTEALKAAGHDIQTRNEVAGRMWRLKQKGVVIVRGPVPLTRKQRTMPPKPIPVTERALRLKYQPPPGTVRHDKGVEYLKNTENGCKAILDKRGRHGLHLVCGKLRCELDGVRSPYCEDHCIKYMSYSANRRLPSGQVSEAG